MSKTPYLGWVYPTDGQSRWFSIFRSMVEAMDSSVYTVQEDQKIVLTGAGVISWNAGTNTLTLAEDLHVLALSTGHYGIVSAGSFTVQVGNVVWVEMPRAPGSNVSLSLKTGTSMPSSERALWLFARLPDDSIVWRTGRRFEDGESGYMHIETVEGAGIFGWERQEVMIQTAGDQWIGNGATESASSQSGLSTGFPEPLIAPDSVDVFLDGVLQVYTSGVPSAGEWTWIQTGTPSPVVQIGPGASSGSRVVVRFPRGKATHFGSWLRRQVEIQSGGDTWIGNGATESASSQSGLSTGFPEPIINPDAVEVYYNGSLARYVTGAPTAKDEWRWVQTGTPEPVIEIGSGSMAGDIVTIRIPTRA